MDLDQEKYKELLNEYRDPKNHHLAVQSGSIKQYEVKKLDKNEALKYLKLYYKIFYSWTNLNRPQKKSDFQIKLKFRETARKEVMNHRPAAERNNLYALIESLTKKRLIDSSYKIPISVHLTVSCILLIAAYLFTSNSGTWDGQGSAFTILSFSTLFSGIITLIAWLKLGSKSNLNNIETSIFVYSTTVSIALIMTVFIVSPYEPESDITCYKVNGETECFSERQFDEMLDKYRD